MRREPGVVGMESPQLLYRLSDTLGALLLPASVAGMAGLAAIAASLYFSVARKDGDNALFFVCLGWHLSLLDVLMKVRCGVRGTPYLISRRSRGRRMHGSTPRSDGGVFDPAPVYPPAAGNVNGPAEESVFGGRGSGYGRRGEGKMMGGKMIGR